MRHMAPPRQSTQTDRQTDPGIGARNTPLEERKPQMSPKE